MVYGTGGVSGFLVGLLASSKSRLYSSRGSVTLPEAGTGGGATSSAAAARPGRTSTQAKKIANIFFICHLPFCRVDKLTLHMELDFQRLVQKPNKLRGQKLEKKREWEESRHASLSTNRP